MPPLALTVYGLPAILRHLFPKDFSTSIATMNFWLNLFTPDTWTRFRGHGASISGFRPRLRRTAYESVKPGDLLFCYLVKLSRWSGVLKVQSEPFEDTKPIFADSNDPFTTRFKVTPDIVLDFEHSVPIQEPDLWNKLSFTRELEVGALGWAYRAGIRQSLVQITKENAEILLAVLRQQQQTNTLYELNSHDRKHIA